MAFFQITLENISEVLPLLRDNVKKIEEMLETFSFPTCVCVFTTDKMLTYMEWETKEEMLKKFSELPQEITVLNYSECVSNLSDFVIISTGFKIHARNNFSTLCINIEEKPEVKEKVWN